MVRRSEFFESNILLQLFRVGTAATIVTNDLRLSHVPQARYGLMPQHTMSLVSPTRRVKLTPSNPADDEAVTILRSHPITRRYLRFLPPRPIRRKHTPPTRGARKRPPTSSTFISTRSLTARPSRTPLRVPLEYSELKPSMRRARQGSSYRLSSTARGTRRRLYISCLSMRLVSGGCIG